jgi:MFS family permease
MPIFPVYALLFADAGLSLGEISLLLVLWSVVGIVLEVPSGAWADAVSRRALLAAGSVSYGAAFASWVLVPSLAGFAVGFCLWGLSGALTSGTFQALAYDELAAAGARERYARVIGLGHALAIVAMTLATVAAAPLLAVGGYALAGWVSVAVCGVQLAVVLSLPSAPQAVSAEEVEAGAPPGAWARWRHALRTGLDEATTSALVRGAVLASGAVLALQFLDEYFGLLLREQGAALVLVPVLFGVISAGEVVGALVASRGAGWSPGRVGACVSAAGALVAVGAWVGEPVVAALVLAVGYGLVQVAVVVTEVRLQDSIEADARATVISTSNVLAEGLSVAAYVAVAVLAGDGVAAPVLVTGLVALALGPAVARLLPRAAGSPA